MSMDLGQREHLTKMYSSHNKNTLYLLISPQYHSSPIGYFKLITCHCILILGFVMQTYP